MNDYYVDIIPISCGRCEYGEIWDMSVDDLVTVCELLRCQQDWCGFPDRIDGTIRMFGCPLKVKSV